MKKTNIVFGSILALALVYSSPAFSENGPSGASGMLSAGEMRAAIKSGGSFTSQSNVLNGGTQVRYGGTEASRSAPITNANTIHNLNTKGYAAGPGETTIFSGAAVSSIVTNAVSQAQTVYNGGKNIVDYASYELNRGVSAAMGNAVTALQNSHQAVAHSLNLPVINTQSVSSNAQVGKWVSTSPNDKVINGVAVSDEGADYWMGGRPANVKINPSGNMHLPPVELP